MDRKQLLDLLPHRGEGLKIDRVIEINLEKLKIIAERDVPKNCSEAKNHYPDTPIIPGVSIIESIAQAGSVMGYQTFGKKAVLKLSSIEKARFRRNIHPGETITIKVSLIHRKRNFLFLEGKAYVGEELAVEVKFIASS